MPTHALRIGLLIDRWDPERGGAERALAGLAGHLAQRGHRVVVVAREARATEFECVCVRAPWAATRGARERSLGRALVRAAAACDVTVGVRHLERVDLYWPHGGSVRASARARALAAGRDPERVLRGRFRVFHELERALLDGGGARAVACVSELVRSELASEYPAARARLALVENGVDLERFHPRRRAELAAERGSEPRIVFAARDAELKGLETLLTALAGLRARPWRLLVAGPRRAARWQARALSLGLAAARIEWRAWVAAEHLAHGTDLCVLPTWRDTCGSVVLEALAAGTPAITTRAAGAARAIASPRCGSVLERAGDPGLLATALAEWLTRIETGAVDPLAVRGDARLRAERECFGEIEESLIRLASVRP